MGAIALIEVIIGMVFVVLLTSIIVSLINEILVTNLKIRSKLLKKAICRMLDDSTHSEILGDNFYSHPLIKKLMKNKRSLPSYVSPATFSKVLVDVLHGYGEKTSDIKATINKLPEKSETKTALLTLLNDAGGDIDKFKANIEQWFNESMNRLSGRYKRYTQVQLFVIGICVAVTLNVDIIHISKELSDDKNKRIQLAEAAREYVMNRQGEAIKTMTTLEAKVSQQDSIAPIELPSKSNTEELLGRYESRISSYDEEIANIKETINPVSGLVGIFWQGKVTNPISLIREVIKAPVSAYLGWLITALAVSLGSAFWFDMLKRVINIRGSSKPEPKK